MAGLAHETVTLFVPLSGRSHLWSDFAGYLERQSWPHNQIRLVLFDTSQHAMFSQRVAQWVARCDYPDVRHVRTDVGSPGLADDDRRRPDVQDAVRVAMARIYNRLAREVATEYVWILEDDILPPDDACRRLLHGFDRRTVSVSGVYDSRFDQAPCVWDRRFQHFAGTTQEVGNVFGNGFGCVVLRGGLLRETVFQATGDFDRVFYRRVNDSGFLAKVDWRVRCEHRSCAANTKDCAATRSIAAPKVETTQADTDVSSLCEERADPAESTTSVPHWQNAESDAGPHLNHTRFRNSSTDLLKSKSLLEPWHEYPLTVCIPYFDTPDLLRVTVRLWQLQVNRPFLLIVDTGSTSQESAILLDQLQAERGVEVARLGIHSAVEHLSDRVSIGMDYAFSRCPTEYLLATHVDVFPRHRDLVGKFLEACSATTPVVGWEMSPRGPGPTGLTDGHLSDGIPGHALTIFHIPTMDRIGAGWTLRRAHHVYGLPRGHTEIHGWPDTEVCLGRLLDEHGISPVFLGRETNADLQETDDWVHARSSTVQLLLLRQYRDRRASAYLQALARLRDWEQQCPVGSINCGTP